MGEILYFVFYIWYLITKLGRPPPVRITTLLGNACGNCNVVPIAVLLVLGSRRRCNHRIDLATRVLPPQIGCKNPGTETVLASQRNMFGCGDRIRGRWSDEVYAT